MKLSISNFLHPRNILDKSHASIFNSRFKAQLNASFIQDMAAAIFIIFVFVSLMENISKVPIWQDEAESALNALTINTRNIIPRAFEKNNLPMYECRLIIEKKNDPMYDYYPTSYYYTPYVSMHGWLPYYFYRTGIFLFGRNALGARFFSPIFFALFLFVFYKILKRCSNYLTAILSVVCISMMPNVLTFALEARYHSYTLFFVALTLFFWLRYMGRQSISNFIFFITSSLMLFYTNMLYFILISSAMLICIQFTDRKLTLRYILGMIICFIGALPYLLITKAYLLFGLFPKKTDCLKSGLPLLRRILNYNDAILVAILIFILFFVNRIIRGWIRQGVSGKVNFLEFFTFFVILIGYPFVCLMTPEISFYERIFLPLAPFLIYAAIEGIFSLFGLIKEKISVAFAGTFFCILLLLCPVVARYDGSLNFFYAGAPFAYSNISRTYPQWVNLVIERIKNNGVDNPLILSNFEQFVFTYYTDYEAQLLWPVKKEFIDSTERDLFIVLEAEWKLDMNIRSFLPEKQEKFFQDEKHRNYYDRIAHCEKTIVGKVTLYKCLASDRCVPESH